MEKNYKSSNIEILNVWDNELKKKFIFEIPENIHLLEKTKIVKTNILDTLHVAHEIASYASQNNIFETSQSKQNIEKEMDKIRKDIVSIAVFGQMGSGKSSFLNSLVGEELLTVSSSKATATISVIRHISNFDDKKDGDIEIHYKSEKEILLNVDKALSELGTCFGGYNEFEYSTINELLNIKEVLQKKIDESNIKELDKYSKKIARGVKKFITLILDGLEENKKNIDNIILENSLEEGLLIDEMKSVFISNVIFYKDIKLLKNIELVDTPGLGSNSQLDTRKSEEFLSKADIVMILTDAREPMQKESESDILDILEDIQKKENKKDFFDKVFIIVNKIDENEELDREGIKELLTESLEEADIEIRDDRIMFVSAMYEYQKKFSKDGLKDLYLKNKSNIGENDLEVIEKTIYNFSAAESTSKFLTENISKIDNIFNALDINFENNIKILVENIENTQSKINKFQDNRIRIKSELTQELEIIIQDEYRTLLAQATLRKEEEFSRVANYDYAYNKALKEEIFKSANTDNSSSSHYTKVGKKFLTSITNALNVKIEQDINNNLFSTEKKEKIQKELENKILVIQKKYENEYGVKLELKDIQIDKMKINFSNNIDLKRSLIREIRDFFSPLIGTEKKYASSTANEWAKYSNDKYKDAITKEIKSKIDIYKSKVQQEVKSEISNIVDTIGKQLNQELEDKTIFNKNKEQATENKVTIQKAFKTLKDDYIDIATKQNQQLFK